MTANATHSNGDGVPFSASTELAKLVERAADLQRSIDTWNRWYVFSLGLVIIAAIAVGVTNRFVIVRQRQKSIADDAVFKAKDQQLRFEREEKDRAVAGELRAKDVKIGETAGIAAKANERAAKLELEAATQRERAAKADERAANAEEGVFLLQKQIAPRSVNGEVFIASLAGKPKATVEIMYAKDDSDSWQVAQFLMDFLHKAEWEAKLPVPIPPGKGDEPAAFAFGGHGSGITVVSHWSRESFRKFTAGHPDWGAPSLALKDAIEKAMGVEVALVTLPAHNPPEGTLQIIVDPKR